eukprot:NODE_4917_length_751_cov_18.525641_g4117_i0.p1 GENE.NODE_4917_length_751_cov_18.525641_g4117_i0~~NODE_4917_length_751_cov_18.525641_g4117_i0.p1  ORF type:complete len:191 (-),score=56.16 NODE_4917_length_751_cov_18.525641_g4117_i0:64-636(-)
MDTEELDPVEAEGEEEEAPAKPTEIMASSIDEARTAIQSETSRVILIVVTINPAHSVPCQAIGAYIDQLKEAHPEDLLIIRLAGDEVADIQSFLPFGSVPFWSIMYGGVTIGQFAGSNTDKTTSFLKKAFAARVAELERIRVEQEEREAERRAAEEEEEEARRVADEEQDQEQPETEQQDYDEEEEEERY